MVGITGVNAQPLTGGQKAILPDQQQAKVKSNNRMVQLSHPRLTLSLQASAVQISFTSAPLNARSVSVYNPVQTYITFPAQSQSNAAQTIQTQGTFVFSAGSGISISSNMPLTVFQLTTPNAKNTQKTASGKESAKPSDEKNIKQQKSEKSKTKKSWFGNKSKKAAQKSKSETTKPTELQQENVHKTKNQPSSVTSADQTSVLHDTVKNSVTQNQKGKAKPAPPPPPRDRPVSAPPPQSKSVSSENKIPKAPPPPPLPKSGGNPVSASPSRGPAPPPPPRDRSVSAPPPQSKPVSSENKIPKAPPPPPLPKSGGNPVSASPSRGPAPPPPPRDRSVSAPPPQSKPVSSENKIPKAPPLPPLPKSGGNPVSASSSRGPVPPPPPPMGWSSGNRSSVENSSATNNQATPTKQAAVQQKNLQNTPKEYADELKEAILKHKNKKKGAQQPAKTTPNQLKVNSEQEDLSSALKSSLKLRRASISGGDDLAELQNNKISPAETAQINSQSQSASPVTGGADKVSSAAKQPLTPPETKKTEKIVRPTAEQLRQEIEVRAKRKRTASDRSAPVPPPKKPVTLGGVSMSQEHIDSFLTKSNSANRAANKDQNTDQDDDWQ